jgi:polysaccharide pyruvyl transferase WcaK-like protein
MKILIVGASGYGNLGDDAYKQIFAEYLNEHEILFDSPYPDLRAVDWCDILIIGGGGLIYKNESAHDKYMATYMDRALSQNKKIIFSSIGVQFKPKEKNTLILEENTLYNLGVWKKYLDKAALITVRSPKDKELLGNITSNTNLHYFPDLCYLIKPVDYHLTLPNAHIFVISDLGFKRGHILKEFENIGDNPFYTVIMSKDDIQATNDFLNFFNLPRDHYINRDNLTPGEAARIFKDAEKVMTCRYHGLIFSRAVGCKNIVNYDLRNKSLQELPENEINKVESLNHIIQINKVIG